MRVVVVVVVVVLLVPGHASSGGPPVIREQPYNVVARRNDPATLNCAASGAARIRWFRDGQEVATSSQDPRSHRVLLSSGSLFFLRVTSGRRDSDAGTYWCVASNSYGATRSHNATLTVATLAYDFQTPALPQLKVRLGDPISLPCRPPRGSPTPVLTWLREGRPVTNSSRITVTEDGDMVISRAVQQDSGIYVCRARNAAGTRESAPTQLSVITSPTFEERPNNVTTASGVAVKLQCQVTGAPTPSVTWRRLDGKMPIGRVTIEDQQLMLEQVTAADSGVYICEAENEAGRATAQATLTVIDAPELTQRSQNIQVMIGHTAQVSCIVEGQPEPLVLWRLPTLDRTALLAPGHTSGHASMSEDGQSLTLQGADTQDSGTYFCWGVSSGGGVSASVEVVVVAALPPPVVGVGPRDLEVAPGGVATFPCEVVSEAAEANFTWWYRPAAHLSPRQVSPNSNLSRVLFLDNGALTIKDVSLDDAGIYSCQVKASTGTADQTAVLQVSDEAQKQEAVSLPAPPTKPRVVGVNQTAVELSWLPNSQVNSEWDQWYSVEYWRHGWPEWRVADAVITQESCVVAQLTPGYTYTFLVRAVSSQGASFPSPWSDPITSRAPRDPSLTSNQVAQARRRLSRPTVSLTDAAVSAPDSVLLSWHFLVPTHDSVEGVLVYSVGRGGQVQVATVLGASSSHLLHNLTPNTHYTFFLVPFWRSVEGTPSNSFSLTTPEDVPVAAPSDVQVLQRTEESALIKWSALTEREARGQLVGYRVLLGHNNTHATHTVTTPWLEAHGLLPDGLYTVRVAALTGAGLGPFSDPVLVDSVLTDSLSLQDSNVVRDSGTSVLYATPEPAWLAYLLIPLVFLLFLGTMCYVRRLRHKPTPSDPPHVPALYQEPFIYSDHHSVNMYSEQQFCCTMETEKDYSISSSRVLKSGQLPNEYAEPRVAQPNEIAEPYATTALLAPPSPRLIHGRPWRHPGNDSGVQVNWTTILPPPPACPPPRDVDLGAYTPQGIRKISLAAPHFHTKNGSEHYGWASDGASDHIYDAYSQMTPAQSRGRFITFNSLDKQTYQKVPLYRELPRPPDPLASDQ